MSTYNYELKIPKNRVAVLIGKKGEVKKELEEETKTKINIDSEEGDVFVEGKDAIGLLSVREVIKAIGRGFNPEVAKLLLKQDYAIEIIQIPGTKKNQFKRIKGRVIGSEGRCRRTIEDLTKCYISVFGKTVSVIGPVERIVFARRAIEMLFQGSPHSKIYKMLEKTQREIR